MKKEQNWAYNRTLMRYIIAFNPLSSSSSCYIFILVLFLLMKSFDVHRAEIIYGGDGFYAWIISQGQNLMESGTTHSLLAHRINKK